MLKDNYSLAQMGWSPFFSQQLSLEETQDRYPARITCVQRSLLLVLSEHGESQVTLPDRLRPDRSPGSVTVGDWVIVRNETSQVIRVLERQSVIARIAAGTVPIPQSIAANLSTLFVVTSCNDDFNPSRLERYLTIAHDARVMPVIVLTKADVCKDLESCRAAVQGVSQNVAVIALNALEAAQALSSLSPWLTEGQTVAFVGSSGVGKSTLINSLLETDAQETGGVREHDSKGRHTTTARYLLRAPCGAWLIDTPGMRELKIGAVATGLERTFVDIESLASQCKFRDCNHGAEVGCAVRAAVADGRIESRRLESYMKLAREAQRATTPPWKLHEQNQRVGRLSRNAQKQRREEKGRE